MKLKLTIAIVFFTIIVHAQTKITISKVAELNLPSNAVKVDNSAIAKMVSENLKSPISADAPIFNYQYKVNDVSLSFSPMKGTSDAELNNRLQIMKNSQRGISKREVKDESVNGNYVRYYIDSSAEKTTVYFYCLNVDKSKAFTSTIRCKKSDENFAKNLASEIVKSVKFI